MPPRGQNFRRETDRFAEISSQRCQGGQKKIAKAVAFEAGAFIESMLKNFREKSFVFRQRNNAVAHVAWRKHVELFAQSSAGAAIVSYGHHRAEFGDVSEIGPGRKLWIRRADHIFLESLKKRGKTSASANCHY